MIAGLRISTQLMLGGQESVISGWCTNCHQPVEVVTADAPPTPEAAGRLLEAGHRYQCGKGEW